VPWRFVIVPKHRRELLAEVFGLALLDRDPNATPEQVESAREKAYRAPFLMLAIARLAGTDTQTEIGNSERLVSFGCAIQNILLSAHGAGFGTGLTSGQAMASPRLRALFSLNRHEQAVCCINIGTVTKRKPARLRPDMASFVTSL
jgi:nitroreductase